MPPESFLPGPRTSTLLLHLSMPHNPVQVLGSSPLAFPPWLSLYQSEASSSASGSQSVSRSTSSGRIHEREGFDNDSANPLLSPPPAIYTTQIRTLWLSIQHLHLMAVLMCWPSFKSVVRRQAIFIGNRPKWSNWRLFHYPIQLISVILSAADAMKIIHCYAHQSLVAGYL